MAKKKQDSRKIALMLILIAGVWGAVFYQIFFNKKGDDPVAKQVVKQESASLETLEESKYKLMRNYVDPFLGSMKVTKKKVEKKEPEAKPAVQVNFEKDNFLKDTEYKGIINNKTGTTAYVMHKKIGHLMKQGDSLDVYQLKDIAKDSILFTGNKDAFWIMLK